MSGKSNRKISFSPIGTVTKTLDLGDEIESFDFTFEIPSPAKMRKTLYSLPDDVMESFDRIQHVFSGIDDKDESEKLKIVEEISTRDGMNFEEMAIEICALCLKSWTLESPCSMEYLERMEPQSVITGMFIIILAEIAARKNS